MEKKINVGVIGYGTVGRGTVQTLIGNAEEIKRKTRINVVVAGVADTRIADKNDLYLEQVPMKTAEADELIENPDIDVIVELIGGTGAAFDIILKALKNGKHVVTANKALLATRGKELIAAAAQSHRRLMFEASVGGGIPVLSVLQNDLTADKILKIEGIVNGTCNYILTRMEQEKLPFETILADAQKLGYAEADPSGDVEGYDSVYKMIILAYLAYGKWVDVKDVARVGITKIDLAQIEAARLAGKRIKLIGTVEKQDNDIFVAVKPTAVEIGTQLAAVSGVFNGIQITGDKVGPLFLQGQGAGSLATASAVCADILKIAGAAEQSYVILQEKKGAV